MTRIRSGKVQPGPQSREAESSKQDRAGEEQLEKQLQEIQQWKEEMLLDFAAFDSSVVRAQFMHSSNQKERERYNAQRVGIVEKTELVKQSITDLRAQLRQAKETLALRRTYDELTDKILGNRMLRPRADQAVNLSKLQAEIADLDTEAQEYAQTWSERRAQFSKIVDEGMTLRRLIRDEKEEVERREGMQGEEGDEPSGKSGTSTRAPSRSRTPVPNARRPDGKDHPTVAQDMDASNRTVNGIQGRHEIGSTSSSQLDARAAEVDPEDRMDTT